MFFDLIIHHGTVVKPGGAEQLDIGIKKGKIAQFATKLLPQATNTIDASGKLVFPGFIDAHTHMGIPIKNIHSIDDFASGSIAAACGGITTIIDFTVQQPGESLQQSINRRIDKAEGKSHVDFALHVNITDQPEKRVDEIPGLIKRGFSAFKVFSTYRQAGMMIDWPQFRQVLPTVHRHGGLLFLHAEDNELVETQTRKHIEAGHRQAIYHPRSRTAEAEAQAITRAAAITRELRARLYIVHLSSRAGLEAAREARKLGTELILETCPQYLLLNEEKYLAKNGHYWITTPPLRTKDDQEALWQALATGEIEVVATDHCPFTISQKESGCGDFFLTPNGIPGVETLFPLLYTYGVTPGRISLEQLIEVLARKPAELFGFTNQKGAIQIGADADLVIFNPNAKRILRSRDLHGNADWSPFAGFEIQGVIEHTFLRGRHLVKNGLFVGDEVFGSLLKNKKVTDALG